MGTEPEPVNAQKGSMQDIFARCLKKNIAQVCTLLIHVLGIKRNSTYCQSYASIAEKNQHPRNYGGYVIDVCVNLLVTANVLFVPPMYKYVM